MKETQTQSTGRWELARFPDFITESRLVVFAVSMAPD